MTPAGPDPLKLGYEALKAGRFDEAGRFCQQALARDPEKPEAHFLVGLIASEIKDWGAAIRGFGSVTKLAPAHSAAWAQLARAFLRIGHMVRAEQTVEEAARLGSDDPFVQDLIGVTYSLLGNQKAAHDWYARAFHAAPDHPAFGIDLATTLTFLGASKKAEDVLAQVLRQDERNPQANWQLSSLKRAANTDRAHRLFDFANQSGSDQARAFLAYAAGKEFEDCEAWNEAFAAFEIGARAKRKSVAFDEVGEEAMFRALADAYDQEWAAQSGPGHDSNAPIFVIGQPRTGTTLIERIITSHTDVESAGELQQFGLSVRRMVNTPRAPRWSAEVMRAAATINSADLGKEYLRAAAPMLGDAPRFVDKLPGNYVYVPLILKALPNAKIVHLTRDPMDSCFASYKQLFAEAYFHSYDQAEMARHHIRYRRLMDHWRDVFPGRFLDISYEETVQDVEPNARLLIDFLELDWQDDCLAFHQQKSHVATASAVQVREKAHTRSVGRWKRYEGQLAPMAQIIRAAGL